MKARVFISWGQKSKPERRLAEDSLRWFSDEGYEPYVAIQVHTFKDLNAAIIEALKTCDYCILINLTRELVIDPG